jgi:hypothetical protein
MICPENFLISWLYVFVNVIFTTAIGMLGVWLISKLIAFGIAERQKYQPNAYLAFLASESVRINLLQIGFDWWKHRNYSESEKDEPKPSQEIPNIIKTILTKIIDDSIGASNLKERIELKSKLMNIIEGFEHINKLIVSEPEAINDILNRIKVNTLTTVLAEIKDDSILKEKWVEFKLTQDKTFCIKDLPVGAIYNTVDTLKANLVK